MLWNKLELWKRKFEWLWWTFVFWTLFFWQNGKLLSFIVFYIQANAFNHSKYIIHISYSIYFVLIVILINVDLFTFSFFLLVCKQQMACKRIMCVLMLYVENARCKNKYYVLIFACIFHHLNSYKPTNT